MVEVYHAPCLKVLSTSGVYWLKCNNPCSIYIVSLLLPFVLPKGAQYMLLGLHHSLKDLNDAKVFYSKLNLNSTLQCLGGVSYYTVKWLYSIFCNIWKGKTEMCSYCCFRSWVVNPSPHWLDWNWAGLDWTNQETNQETKLVKPWNCKKNCPVARPQKWTSLLWGLSPHILDKSLNVPSFLRDL